MASITTKLEILFFMTGDSLGSSLQMETRNRASSNFTEY